MMKKAAVWIFLLLLGICPFVCPFLSAFTRMFSWTLTDWLIMYSYVYWPTYLIGAVLIGISVYRLIRKKRK